MMETRCDRILLGLSGSFDDIDDVRSGLEKHRGWIMSDRILYSGFRPSTEATPVCLCVCV